MAKDSSQSRKRDSEFLVCRSELQGLAAYSVSIPNEAWDRRFLSSFPCQPKCVFLRRQALCEPRTKSVPAGYEHSAFEKYYCDASPPWAHLHSEEWKFRGCSSLTRATA